MNRWREIACAVAGITALAVLLSFIWHVPYLYTLIGVAAWAFIGHIVTADDDARGGWSNPDGSIPFPWQEVAVKTALLALLLVVAVLFPGLRAFGGG